MKKHLLVVSLFSFALIFSSFSSFLFADTAEQEEVCWKYTNIKNKPEGDTRIYNMEWNGSSSLPTCRTGGTTCHAEKIPCDAVVSKIGISSYALSLRFAMQATVLVTPENQEDAENEAGETLCEGQTFDLPIYYLPITFGSGESITITECLTYPCLEGMSFSLANKETDSNGYVTILFTIE